MVSFRTVPTSAESFPVTVTASPISCQLRPCQCTIPHRANYVQPQVVFRCLFTPRPTVCCSAQPRASRPLLHTHQGHRLSQAPYPPPPPPDTSGRPQTACGQFLEDRGHSGVVLAYLVVRFVSVSGTKYDGVQGRSNVRKSGGQRNVDLALSGRLPAKEYVSIYTYIYIYIYIYMSFSHPSEPDQIIKLITCAISNILSQNFD